MKKISIISGILLLIGAVVFFEFFNSRNVDEPTPSTELPTETRTLQDQTVRDGTQQIIVTALKAQAPELRSVNAEGTVVASNYALQFWNDGYTGGVALFKYQPTGWELIPGGAGAWNVPELVAVGVPEDIAYKLIDGTK